MSNELYNARVQRLHASMNVFTGDKEFRVEGTNSFFFPFDETMTWKIFSR